MIYGYVQISLDGYFEAEPDVLKRKIEEAINIACSYLEDELKHDTIGYHITQFKTDEV